MASDESCDGLRLVFGISDAVRVDGEDGFALGQARRIVDLADALLPSALAKVEPGKEEEQRLQEVRLGGETQIDLQRFEAQANYCKFVQGARKRKNLFSSYYNLILVTTKLARVRLARFSRKWDLTNRGNSPLTQVSNEGWTSSLSTDQSVTRVWKFLKSSLLRIPFEHECKKIWRSLGRHESSSKLTNRARVVLSPTQL